MSYIYVPPEGDNFLTEETAETLFQKRGNYINVLPTQNVSLLKSKDNVWTSDVIEEKKGDKLLYFTTSNSDISYYDLPPITTSNNSLVIGNNITASNQNALYINPIRVDESNGYVLTYSPLTKEIIQSYPTLVNAYQNVNIGLSVPANNLTKIIFNMVNDNVGSYYNPLDGKFQPSVSGYYQINCCANFNIVSPISGISSGYIAICKNGSEKARGNGIFQNTTLLGGSWSCSAMIFLNGTTDYLDVRFMSFRDALVVNGESMTYLNIFRVR